LDKKETQHEKNRKIKKRKNFTTVIKAAKENQKTIILRRMTKSTADKNNKQTEKQAGQEEESLPRKVCSFPQHSAIPSKDKTPEQGQEQGGMNR
jgi:hypothetical protein